MMKYIPTFAVFTLAVDRTYLRRADER